MNLLVRNKKTILLSVILSLMSVSILKIDSVILSVFNKQLLKLEKINRFQYKLNISDFKLSEKYYVSIGKVQGICSIYVDDVIVNSNKSFLSNIKGQLSLEASFKYNGQQNLMVRCEKENGFKGGITNIVPFVSNLKYSYLIQKLREFIYILLAPLLAGIFFINTLIPYFQGKNITENNNSKILFFGLSTFLYALSISHFPRLIFNDILSSNIHIFLRYTFIFGYVLFLDNYVRSRKEIKYILTGYIITFLVLTNIDFAYALKFYTYTFYTFPLIYLACVYYVFNPEFIKTNSRLIQLSALLCFFSQTFDLVGHLGGVKFYNTPITVGVFSMLLVFFQNEEKVKAFQLDRAYQEILSIIYSEEHISKKINKIGKKLFNSVGFERVSIFIDDVCLGKQSKKGISATRLYMFGYDKNVDEEQSIYFNAGKGCRMLCGSMSTLNKGDDDAYYTILNFSNLAWINLSDNYLSDPYHVNESMHFIGKIESHLRIINEKVNENSLRIDYSTEKIKKFLGFGTFKLRSMSIFLDIVDYSKHNLKYPNDEFVRFVDNVYFPSLIKTMHPRCIPEKTEGDLIYLIMAEKFLINETFDEGVFNSVNNLLNFVNNEGKELCFKNGFNPIEVTIGICSGIINVIVDEFSFRSSGNSVNFAKRLQDCCSPGHFIVDGEINQIMCNKDIESTEIVTVLSKKDFLKAYKRKINRTISKLKAS